MARHASYDVDGNKTLDTEIQVTEDMYAPPAYRWNATVGDYDLGATVGTGRTPLDAIVELLDELEEAVDNLE